MGGVFACPGKHRPNPSTKPEPDHHRGAADPDPDRCHITANPSTKPEPDHHRVAADPDPDSGAVPDPHRCRIAADSKPQSEPNTRADTVADP